jgi:cardiolipin synthase
MTIASPLQRSQALSLPNVLTYGRLAAVPAVVAILFWPRDDWMRWVALAIFVAAGVTDYFDGYFARLYAQQSTLGRMLDPIADKLLVAACLLMLVSDSTIEGWSLWAAIVILCREILVSGLREYLAELRVSVPVTQLAKYKTLLQNFAVGFLIAGAAGDAVFPNVSFSISAEPMGPVSVIGVALLWLSAVLTLYTGYDYFRAGVQHLIED